MAGDAVRAQMSVDDGLASGGVAAVGQQLIGHFRIGHLEAALRPRGQVLLDGGGDFVGSGFAGQREDVEFESGIELARDEAVDELLQELARCGIGAAAERRDDGLLLRNPGRFGINYLAGEFHGHGSITDEKLAECFDADFGRIAFAGGGAERADHGLRFSLRASQ